MSKSEKKEQENISAKDENNAEKKELKEKKATPNVGKKAVKKTPLTTKKK